MSKKRQEVQMQAPGGEGEEATVVTVSRSAFDKVWSGKGWTLVEPAAPNSAEDDHVVSAANTGSGTTNPPTPRTTTKKEA